jgi:hypothetical protein
VNVLRLLLIHRINTWIVVKITQMKSYAYCIVLACACHCLPIMAQNEVFFDAYTAPRYGIEDYTHEDQSISRVLVFSTIPGVSYTVETSHDLLNWTTDQTFYGLGQDIAISMIQTAATPNPPPVPSPEAPAPTPVTFVSLVMRPASTGGLILSWKSLDSQQPVEHHCASLVIGPEWQGNPFYMKRFDRFYFCISHPFASVSPKPNQPIGSKDADMLASFESHIAAMSQEIIDAEERSRLNPIVATPVDPMSRKFFRIVADWSLDSDFDLSPDWLEFLGMLGLCGMQGSTVVNAGNGNFYTIVSNPLGDATTPTGEAAGTKLDTDGDGIPDVEDMQPISNLINMKKMSVRFALVPVAIPESSDDFQRYALQTNDKGQVLFRNALWQNGQTQALNIGSFANTHALAMNQKGEILGKGAASTIPYNGLCFWSSANQAPQWISTMDGDGNSIYADMTEGMYFSSFGNEDIFTDSRRFCATGTKFVPVSGGNSMVTVGVPQAEWKISASGQVSQNEVAQDTQYVHDPNYRWKYPDILGDTIIAEKAVTNAVRRLVVTEGGYRFALEGAGSCLVHAIGNESNWVPVGYLLSAIDMSRSGIVAKKSAITWLNSKNLALPRVAPHIPETWQEQTEWKDLSPKGHILLVKKAQGAAESHEKAALAFPVMLEDNQFATGVDDQSALSGQSSPGLQGYQDQLWVMAPQGTWSNETGTFSNSNAFTIKIPLDTASMSITCDIATLSAVSLTGDSTALEISGTGTNTVDGKITLSMAGQQALSFPIGVKSMKKRTVKVRVYPVRRNAASPATAVPTKEAIEEELNAVFGKQINAYFSATIEPQQTYEYDVVPEGSGLLAAQDGAISNAQEAQYLQDALPTGDHDIVIYFFNDGLLEGDNTGAVGGSYIASNLCMVLASNHNSVVRTNAQVLRTLAHEVGHCMIDSALQLGHPDEGAGVAVLPGTDVTRRLMCSGFRRREDGILLVKAEWDAADAWLAKFVDSID